MSPPPKANLSAYTLPTATERYLADALLFLARWIHTHQCPVGTPAPSKKPIRIVCISDTHTSTPDLPSGDVLIHAGDLSNNGTFPEPQRQMKWIASKRHEHKIAVAGNHDLLLDPCCYGTHKDLFAPPYAWQRRTDLQWGDVTYLEDEATTLCVRGYSLTVFGSPRTAKQGNWAFRYPRRCATSSIPPPSAPSSAPTSDFPARPQTSPLHRYGTPPSRAILMSSLRRRARLWEATPKALAGQAPAPYPRAHTPGSGDGGAGLGNGAVVL